MSDKVKRQIVVVDFETTGLDPVNDTVIEVAWFNMLTGARGVFVPPHDPADVLERAESDDEVATALRLNRYRERLVSFRQDVEGEQYRLFYDALAGNTWAGSNPGFDVAFLRPLVKQYEAVMGEFGPLPPKYHHRLLDLSNYAAGVLGVPGDDLPGLARVRELLGVEAEPDHTAMGDVAVTVACFYRLFGIAAERRAA